MEWPKTGDKKAWQAFEEDVDSTLEAALGGGVDRKIEAMTSIIYSMGRERFGVVEQRARRAPAGRGNRREVEISQIRGELRRLNKAYCEATTEEEKQGLQELRDVLRERLKSLRRAEANRRRRKERMKKRAQFTRNQPRPQDLTASPTEYTRAAPG